MTIEYANDVPLSICREVRELEGVTLLQVRRARYVVVKLLELQSSGAPKAPDKI